MMLQAQPHFQLGQHGYHGNVLPLGGMRHAQFSFKHGNYHDHYG